MGYGQRRRNTVPNLPNEDWLVEYLDRTLADTSDPASGAFRKTLHELGRICGTQEILPKSCTLSGSLMNTGLSLASGYAYQGTLDGSKVWVKRVWTYPNGDPQKVKKSLYQTAVVWKRLKHQNIVPLIGITSIPLQLVSELMPGGSLTEYIMNRPHADRLGLLSGSAEGLNYLHSCDVIHGGLKGSNIVVDANGQARITDFGLATVTQSLEYIRSAAAEHFHSAQWIALETLSNRGTYSKEADVFSFAMVTIEAFTGAVPFSDKPPRAAMLAIVSGERPPRPTDPTFTDGLWRLTRRCWNQEAHLRPQVSEVSQVLRNLYVSTPESRIPMEIGVSGSNRKRSKRGDERNESKKVPAADVSNNQIANLEPVAPPKVPINRWTRKLPADKEQNVERKVRALLNELTMEKFDTISDQIIEWVDKSEAEKDGRTLTRVVKLVFESATNGAMLSKMCARLCRKMMEMISPNVQCDGIRNADGEPITGGQLFRRYLLNRCQEDFERGWAAKDAAASVATVKKAAEASGEVELHLDEYYTAQKARRRGLGLIQFIGELYKVQMLTERIMHECIKKLLGNVDNPKEEEIESLCRLLRTVGKLLDNLKAHAHMDIYFTRMKELGNCNSVSPRIQFMLQDIIELRERKWDPRHRVSVPTTIAQVHEEAEKEAMNRSLTTSRSGSRWGGDRGGGPTGEQRAGGLSVAGGFTPRPPPKVGGLLNFGKINKSGSVVMGPSSVWAGKQDVAKRNSTLTRVDPSSNMFMMLGRDGEAVPETGSKPSRPSSRRTSVDLGVGGTAEPQRKKLQLLPRWKPVEEENVVNGGSADHSEDESGDDLTPAMSEAYFWEIGR